MSDRILETPDGPITATRIVWYLLSALTTILLIAAAAWGTGIDTRQTAIEFQQSVLSQRLAGIEARLDILLQRNGFDKYQQDK